LLGSFILDTQQAVLFEQPCVLFPRWPKDAPSDHTSSLPFPCDNELWECRSIQKWAELANPNQQIKLSTAADSSIYDTPHSLDPFRSRLVLAFFSTNQRQGKGDPQNELTAFCKNLAEHDPSGRLTRTGFDIHAHIAARNTPIRDLLIVSGESWLFGKKLENEDDFHNAKLRLRKWLGTDKAQAALGHATSLLRLIFGLAKDRMVQSPSEVGSQGREMNTLHEQWCTYLAALICWACAFGETSTASSLNPSFTPASSIASSAISGTTSPSTATPSSAGYAPLMDPGEADAGMRHFLQITDYEEISDLPTVLATVKGQTKGLLEVVRTRKLDGALGGLLNEASGVLYRLVEGRSRLSHF
jgi:hypothetical protein